MGKSKRNDGWSSEEDKLLGDTIIKTVMDGGTQLNAFEEVASKLNRTPAAVGFRWNSEVRKQYAESLAKAKAIAKEFKKSKDDSKKQVAPDTLETVISAEVSVIEESKEISQPIGSSASNELLVSAESEPVPELPFDIGKLIEFLQYVNEYPSRQIDVLKENEELKAQKNKLQQENDSLRNKIGTLEKELKDYQEESEALIRILNKTKRAVELTEKEEVSKTKETVIA